MVSRPELIGDIGAVSSTSPLASGAAMAVLEQGGNAFDAAVAGGLVLQVVEPHSNGPGGDVAIIAQRSGEEDASVICGQGPMPSGADITHFTGLGLRQIPGSGLLPAAVPGAMGAWLRLLADFGRLPLETVADPAIGYATNGYPVMPDTAKAIGALVPLFEDEWASSGKTYLVGGSAPVAGDRLINPDLAAVLSRLVAEGRAGSTDRKTQIENARRAFYEGFVADAIDGFVASTAVLDASGRRHRGLLTGDDLATWRADVEPALRGDYRGLTVNKPGPWSQGPVFLQQLALLEGYDLRSLAPDSPEYVHLLTEAAKLAFADREAWYGDPATRPDSPLTTLLSTEYNTARRRLIEDRANPDPAPGILGGRTSEVPVIDPDPVPDWGGDWMGQLQSGMPTVVLRATLEPSDTCALVVADRYGNLVAAVPSGGWLKSSPVVPGLGFPLGTRGQTMWLVEGHPNSVAGGKRPRTTLSPTLVSQDGRPRLAFGTPGGDRQDQWTLATFLAAVEFDMDLQRSTEVPLFHTDHFPSSFTPRGRRHRTMVAEAGVGSATVAELRRRGHVVDVVPEMSMGAKACIVGVGRDGFLRAGAGPRGRQAYAVCR
ncbi:gamma-glutamyltransferase family protein [Nocardiopsis prasina]|uniref:gamma-glutamyltransferase family protein n=1 Tax=Nocardiopsis prasina TaxID=2015 RepID=UPI00034942D2|nr:gamma-glutamyltransferase family protein [Nocardiopsis prasina]